MALSLVDAAALSIWPKARTPRLGEFLHSLEAGAAVEENAPADTLVAALEYAGGGPGEPLAADLRAAAVEALGSAERLGIVPIAWGDGRYPPLLATIQVPPAVLWVRGRPEALAHPAAALVGSRGPSEYGLEAATQLAADLARAGAVIVSGLARGIDSAAHRGALQGGGTTVAVLGSGPDIVYPPEHATLAESIAESGAVVSELPPGTPPRAFHFPARNRIIAGLSLVVVVVEAAEQSGSLITADFAAEQARHVMAVPGSIFSGRQAGCHALIRDGAGIVGSAADIEWELAHSHLRRLAGAAPSRAVPSNPILDVMRAGEACDIDALARQTGLAPAVLLSTLLELQLQGAVRRADGSRFVRVSRTC